MENIPSNPEIPAMGEEKPTAAAAAAAAGAGEEVKKSFGTPKPSASVGAVSKYVEMATTAFSAVLSRFERFAEQIKAKSGDNAILGEGASDFEKLVYWDKPLATAGVLVGCTSVYLIPSITGYSFGSLLCLTLLLWVVTNALFRACIIAFEKIGVVPVSSHQVLFGSLLKKENFNKEVIASFAETLSLYIEVCRATLAKALTCSDLALTAKTLGVLYSVHFLIWLFGEFTLTYLVCAGALTVPMTLAIFSDEVDEMRQEVLKKTREVLSAAIENMGPAAKPYVPASITAFCAGEDVPAKAKKEM